MTVNHLFEVELNHPGLANCPDGGRERELKYLHAPDLSAAAINSRTLVHACGSCLQSLVQTGVRQVFEHDYKITLEHPVSGAEELLCSQESLQAPAHTETVIRFGATPEAVLMEYSGDMVSQIRCPDCNTTYVPVRAVPNGHTTF